MKVCFSDLVTSLPLTFRSLRIPHILDNSFMHLHVYILSNTCSYVYWGDFHGNVEMEIPGIVLDLRSLSSFPSLRFLGHMVNVCLTL